MGCFNMKCCLTGMDIVAGDKIVLLLGTKPKLSVMDDCGGYSFQPHYFQLRATPIFGQYDDYGWIEKVDQATWTMAMWCLDAFEPDEGWLNADVSESDRFRDRFLQHSFDQPKGEDAYGAMAFVHMDVWNSLIAATDKKSIQHHFRSMDSTGCFTGEEILAEMKRLKMWKKTSHNTINDSRYEGRSHHWLSLDGDAAQRFALADWIASKCDMTALTGTPEEKEARLNLKYAGYPEAERRAMVSFEMQYGMGERQDQAAFYVPRTKLGWFFPFFGGHGHRSSQNTDGPVVGKLLNLCKEHPALFLQAAAMYEGLCAARMIIRPHPTMPSSGQGPDDGPERGTQAVAAAMLRISKARTKKMASW